MNSYWDASNVAMDRVANVHLGFHFVMYGQSCKLGLYLYKLDFYLFGTSRSNVYGMGTNGILHRLCVARRRFVFINYGGRFRDQHIMPPSFLFYFCFW